MTAQERKEILVKFATVCRRCRRPIRRGEVGYWRKGGGVVCLGCSK